jgi:hypothetical protein
MVTATIPITITVRGVVRVSTLLGTVHVRIRNLRVPRPDLCNIESRPEYPDRLAESTKYPDLGTAGLYGERAIEMNWEEVSLPALETLLSTGEAQPLPSQSWPAWARTTPGFSAAWFSYVGGLPATSTSSLSTGNVHGYVDIERTASEPPALRYYRYLYVKMTDGRVFSGWPIEGSGVRASAGP